MNPIVPVNMHETLKVKVFVIVDQLKNISKRAAALVPKASYEVASIEDSPTFKIAVNAENRKGEIELSAWPN